VAEVILFFAVVAVPIAAGVATVYLRWPWVVGCRSSRRSVPDRRNSADTRAR
jgi:hypothetical protein